MLFARCWLLVEGETEAWVYPAAAVACGWNFHSEGIRVVEYPQSDEGMPFRVANALGIVWLCIGDDDGNRENVERRVFRAYSSDREDKRVIFPHPNIEVNLLRNGFKDVYGRHMPKQKLAQITKKPDERGYLLEYASKIKRAKTKAAADVAFELQSGGARSVPPQIQDVLDRVRALARSTGQ